MSIKTVEIAQRYLQLKAKFKLTQDEIDFVFGIRTDENVSDLCRAVVKFRQIEEEYTKEYRDLRAENLELTEKIKEGCKHIFEPDTQMTIMRCDKCGTEAPRFRHMELETKLEKAVKAMEFAKETLKPELKEPGRTAFWTLVQTLAEVKDD